MKPSDFIRKRIEDRFMGPRSAIPISVPDKEWIAEILMFLDQEAERQNAIIEGLEARIEKSEAYQSKTTLINIGPEESIKINHGLLHKGSVINVILNNEPKEKIK